MISFSLAASRSRADGPLMHYATKNERKLPSRLQTRRHHLNPAWAKSGIPLTLLPSVVPDCLWVSMMPGHGTTTMPCLLLCYQHYGRFCTYETFFLIGMFGV